MMWALLALACSVSAWDEVDTKTAEPLPEAEPIQADDPWGDLLDVVKELPEPVPELPPTQPEEAPEPVAEEE